MSKGTWILAGVVTVGFVSESRSVSDLQARLRELERQSKASSGVASTNPVEKATDPAIARQVAQLQNEVGQLWDRLRRAGGPFPADVPVPATDPTDARTSALVGTGPEAVEEDLTDTGESDDAGPVVLSPELQALFTPENRKVLAEAVRVELNEREKQERARRLRRELEDRWSVLAKRLDVNSAQAEILKPIVRDHYRKYAVLRDRLAQVPAAKRPAFQQRMTDLQQATETKLQGYLSSTQLPKLRTLLHPEPKRSGTDSGGRRSQVGSGSGTSQT